MLANVYMNDFFVKIRNEKIKIDKGVFLALLDLSPIKQRAPYKKAVKRNEIKLSDLKNLSGKAEIPYPLFFASRKIVDAQIKDKNDNLAPKFPSKSEMELNHRGNIKHADIELIVKDLSRKQEFLKNRILLTSNNNSFVGLVANRANGEVTNQQLADDIRSHLNINLLELRGMPKKENALQYLRDKAEEQGILVSFSSYNYMPQNIDKKLEGSGFCIKDSKFPYVFINTRDGDSNPKILETSGRQIFTLMAMLVSIAMNKFVFSTKKGFKNSDNNKIYSIVGELLIPKADAETVSASSLDELKESALLFKVTPSMLLMRLRELGFLNKTRADYFREILKKEIKKTNTNPRRRSLQATGYSKYNGIRFSREVVHAYRKGKISAEEFCNILFRQRKTNPELFQGYIKKFE